MDSAASQHEQPVAPKEPTGEDACATSLGRRVRYGLAAILLIASAVIVGMLALGKDPFNRGYVKKDYEDVGLQPSEYAPEGLMVHEMDGKAVPLASLWAEGPVLLMAGSLTCPISSDACTPFAKLGNEGSTALRRVVLYTIEAHPHKDPSPYSGKEWVTTRNRKAGILRRQPTTIDARVDLAAEFKVRTKWTGDIVLDPMDNACWTALGGGSNVCLLIDQKGMVIARNGWFDNERMQESVDMFLKRLARK